MQQHSYKSGSCALKICATKGVHLTVRYNFGTTEGEKEWPSGSQATPNEALGFFDCIFRDQEVGGSNPLAPTIFFRTNELRYPEKLKSAWLWASKSVLQMRSPNAQAPSISFNKFGFKWRDAAKSDGHARLESNSCAASAQHVPQIACGALHLDANKSRKLRRMSCPQCCQSRTQE